MSTEHLVVDRVGHGGAPLVALHGFPCTRRIWERVLPGLADRGYDVVAPDLRGFGDSPFPADDRYDLAAHAGDVVALLDELTWTSATVVAHDLGAAVALELARHHADRVDALVLMNHVVPRDGAPPWTPAQREEVFDYASEQGHHADAVLARLDTPALRAVYVAEFYRDRGWCPRENFGEADLAHLCKPFEPAARLRASFRDYEVLAGTHPAPAPRAATAVQQPVTVVLGDHDRTLVADADEACRAAYPGLLGVTHVPDAGHFLQWERPGALVTAMPAPSAGPA